MKQIKLLKKYVRYHNFGTLSKIRRIHRQPGSQEKMARAFRGNPNITLHRYPNGDQAFALKDGGNYNEHAATLADQRAAEFSKVNLAIETVK